MKATISLVILMLCSCLGFAAQTEKLVTLADAKVIPKRVLQRSISPKFYQTLMISPVKGWIVVRALVTPSATLSGIRVVHSDLDGAYDKLAVQRAKEIVIAGVNTTGSLIPNQSVLLHLLIYKTADGTLALSFAHLEGAGGDQYEYYGCARLAVLKDDGRLVEIKGPSGLEGKGLLVHEGRVRNNLMDIQRLERRFGAEGSANGGHGF